MHGEGRGLTLEGTRWTVREVDTSHVPGAQSERCLLFEGDGVLRRAWIYPANWADLPERDLTSVMQSRDAAIGVRAWRDEVADPLSSLMGQSNAIIAHTRSLLEAAAAATRANAALREGNRELLECARQARDDMRAAVKTYAGSLRRAGVASDQAIGLVVTAARSGFADLAPIEGADAGVMFDQTVQWCREVYEAA
jgi:hypothetical protein